MFVRGDWSILRVLLVLLYIVGDIISSEWVSFRFLRTYRKISRWWYDKHSSWFRLAVVFLVYFCDMGFRIFIVLSREVFCVVFWGEMVVLGIGIGPVSGWVVCASSGWVIGAVSCLVMGGWVMGALSGCIVRGISARGDFPKVGVCVSTAIWGWTLEWLFCCHCWRFFHSSCFYNLMPGLWMDILEILSPSYQSFAHLSIWSLVQLDSSGVKRICENIRDTSYESDHHPLYRIKLNYMRLGLRPIGTIIGSLIVRGML